MILASEKKVIELVGGVQALPRWWQSGKGQCDECDRFTGLSFEQLRSRRDAVYASWASGVRNDQPASATAVPVPRIYAPGGADTATTQQSTVALSTLNSTAVCQALQLSGVASSVVTALRSDDLDGRALAEIDDEYLTGLDGSLGKVGSAGAARLKRKSFLRSEHRLSFLPLVCTS